ncbi:MAG: cytochrome c family protein [Gemmatimonadota bacterium]
MSGIARFTIATAVGALVVGSLAFAAEPAAKHQYIGTEACGVCHKRDATGNQLGAWQASKHAKAYATLATPEAAAIAKKKGIAGSPQQAPQCLKCHVTAYGVDAAGIAAPAAGKKGFSMEDGVQCEACHGPGSDYKARTVMKDQAAAVAAGLIIPKKEQCVACHNAESPTWDAAKGFNFEEMVKKVAHPNPAKGGAEG